MAERAVVTAIILLITLSLCLYMVEVFVPIGKNMDFRDICRNYLMRMEYCSGLSEEDLFQLRHKLEKAGFCEVIVIAPNSAKAGEDIRIYVEVVYLRNSLVNIFDRKEKRHKMTYDRTAVARRILNR